VAETRIICGFHAVAARLRQDPGSVSEIYLDAGRTDRRVLELMRSAEARGVRTLRVDASRLDGLSAHGRHQGVAARIELARMPARVEDVLDALREPPFLVVLDGVTDPHNLGACLRAADAMGAHAVIAPKDRAVGVTATVSKVASGAAESVPYIMVTNLARTLRELKAREVWIVGADERAGKQLYAASLTGPIAWVFGSEGEGMRRLTREQCDELLSIPMHGTVESLNVSVSAAVCLAETRRQRSHAKT
jgi:23S rRNA (guanosine2251-2'-O)-methyltransferase